MRANVLVISVWEPYATHMGSNEVRAEVAARVRSALGTQGRSQLSLSLEVGIPNTTLARKLAGHIDFTVSEVYAIAQALHLPGSDLLPETLTGKRGRR